MATALHNLSDYDFNAIPDASNMCFGIVVAEWNEDITGALLDGAVKTLEKHGALPENIHVKTVPGSFELIYGAHQMVLHGGYDAVIILGSVIRGETPHFDYICQGVTAGIARLNTTSSTVEPVVMHLPDYLTAEVSPSKILPGHSGVLTVTLNSKCLKDMGLTQTSVYLGAFPGDRVSREKELGVSAVLLPKFDNLTASQLANAPRLYLSTSELNLGAFNDKKKLKGEIIIRNDGKTVLNIKNLQMFTVGLQVSLNKQKLQPGESAKMKITAEQRLIKSARSQPRVLMITNDPGRPKVTIKVIAK